MTTEDNQDQQTTDTDNAPQYITKDGLIEVLTPLLKQVQDQANKAANAVDKKANDKLTALELMLQNLTTPPKKEDKEADSNHEQEPAKPNSISALRKEAEDKIVAKDREWQGKFEELNTRLTAKEQEAKEKETKAFNATLKNKLFQLMTAEKFEDTGDALEILLYTYKADGFIDDGEMILYKPTEESEPETLEAVVDKFKSSNKGKRFLPPTDAPSGAGLTKGSAKTSTQPVGKTPKQKLEEQFKSLGSGKAVISSY